MLSKGKVILRGSGALSSLLRPGASISGSYTDVMSAAFPFLSQDTISPLAFGSMNFADYAPGNVFLNLAKQFRAFQVNGDVDVKGDMYAAYRDADGYFTALPPLTGGQTVQQILMRWVGTAWPEYVGDYILMYEGQGTFESYVNTTLGVPTVNGNVTTIPFSITNTGAAGIEIKAIPDPADYPRNMVVLRDDPAVIAAWQAGERFDPDYLAKITSPTGLRQYRFMDMLETNNSEVVEWADYPSDGYAYYTDGIPVAELCRLANKARLLPWFTVWYQASDACVAAFAQCVRDTLDPTLPHHLERSNEDWNSSFRSHMYSHGHALQDWGTSEVGVTVINGSADVTVADGTAYTDGNPVFLVAADGSEQTTQITAINGNTLTLYHDVTLSAGLVTMFHGDWMGTSWHTKRSVQTAAIWGANIGAHTVNHVLATQVANITVGRKLLEAADWLANEPGGYVAPNTVFSEFAGTSYFGSGFKDTHDFVIVLERILEGDIVGSSEFMRDYFLDPTSPRGLETLQAYLSNNADLADEFSIKFTLYEGGSCHTIANMSTSDPDEVAFTAFMNDWVYGPYAVPVFDALFGLVKTYVDGPFMQFTDIGNPSKSGSWGMWRSTADVNARADGIIAAANVDPWWLPEYAPQVTILAPDTVLEFSTVQEVTVNASTWFSKNADSFSATGLPVGVSMAANGAFSGTPDYVADALGITTTVTATTSAGKSTSVDVVFDVSFVLPFTASPIVFGGTNVVEIDTSGFVGSITKIAIGMWFTHSATGCAPFNGPNSDGIANRNWTLPNSEPRLRTYLQYETDAGPARTSFEGTDSAYPIAIGDQVFVFVTGEAGGRMETYHSVNGGPVRHGDHDDLPADFRIDFTGGNPWYFYGRAPGTFEMSGVNYRAVIWDATMGTIPDMLDPFVSSQFFDGSGLPQAPSLSDALMGGVKLVDLVLDAASTNAGVHNGTLPISVKTDGGAAGAVTDYIT